MALGFGRRVSKDIDENSWQEISVSEIDTSKPFVICLPGSGVSRAIQANGFAKRIENLLGLADLSQDEKPCNVYSLYYDNFSYMAGKSEVKFFEDLQSGVMPDISLLSPKIQNNINSIFSFANELVDSVFKPMVVGENGEINSVLDIANSFRNVHFVSFCAGSAVQKAVNFVLHDYLENVGLSDDEIAFVESQIFVAQAAPIVSESNTHQTNFNFISLCDDVVANSPMGKAAIDTFLAREDKSSNAMVLKGENNSHTVLVEEFTSGMDEEHFSDYYFLTFEDWSKQLYNNDAVGQALPKALEYTLLLEMKGAISNMESDGLVTINTSGIVDTCKNVLGIESNTSKIVVEETSSDKVVVTDTASSSDDIMN